MTDTAYKKSHAGSMKVINNDKSNAIYITANHVTEPDDKAIGVYRWVDALHDFEPYLKKPLNTLLRDQYGIGATTNAHEFNKMIENAEYAFTKTTASRNTLHEILDNEEILLQDSEGVTVIHYPNTNNEDNTFTYNLPKLLGTYDLNTLPTTSILEEHPEGDVLLDIIGNKNAFHNNASGIKTFLGINDDTDTYSKDSANIPTKTFQQIFKPTTTHIDDTVYDYSFFSEILDPSSEQTAIKTTHTVQLTMLYCMINKKPVYITIQKRQGNKENWYYAFHEQSSITPTIFNEVNFNVTSSGAHPAPNIETAIYFIKKEVQKKDFSALLHDINTMVKRMATKSKKIIGYSLTKKEAQSVRNHGKFNEFYKKLLATFQKDLNINKLTPDQITTIIIAFKTIGDQMYLYDSILLTKQDPTKPGRQPWMVTGDTFLKDYSIYTKSTNIMCPTKYGKESGSRKLTVYIKPQAQLTKDQEEQRDKLLSEKKAKLEEDKKLRENEYYENKQLPLTLPNFNCTDVLLPFMDIIKNATSTSTSRNITHFDIVIDNTPITNVHGMTLILLYNAIVHVFLTCQKMYIIKTWLDNTVKIDVFNSYDTSTQNTYLQDYKTKLGSYNKNVAFINAILTNDIPSFINSVLKNVTENFTGITDISNPIITLRNTSPKSSNTLSFDIINTDIITNLKHLHTHKNASIQLLNPFKDFQRQQTLMDYNFGRIINNQLDQLITHTGAGFKPTEPKDHSQFIQMLREDIDELLSYQLTQPQTTYFDALGALLNKINTHQMQRDNPELPLKKNYSPYLQDKKFELLRNISASYETAIDLGYDNCIELLKEEEYTSTTSAYQQQSSTWTFTGPPVSLPQPPPTDAHTTVPPQSPNTTSNKRGLDDIYDRSPSNQPLSKFVRVGAGKKTKRNKKKRTHKKQNKKKQNKTKRNKTK